MQPSKIALVVNPVSSNGRTAKRFPAVARAFEQEKVLFDYTMTEGPGHATELARNYIKRGFDLIVSVGGDGTANEVINGFLLDSGEVTNGASAAFISTGTGGDFARTIDLPRSTQAAVKSILLAAPRRIDLARATYLATGGQEESRLYLNIAGLGIDGEITYRVNRTSKAFGGFISFLWGTVVTLALFSSKEMRLLVDGKTVYDGSMALVVGCNGQYLGGGMHVAPGALVDDGLLEVVAIKAMPKLKLFANLSKVYKGTHLSIPGVVHLQGRKIEVHSPGSVLLQLDGEQVGRAPLKIEIIPSALTIMASSDRMLVDSAPGGNYDLGQRRLDGLDDKSEVG